MSSGSNESSMGISHAPACPAARDNDPVKCNCGAARRFVERAAPTTPAALPTTPKSVDDALDIYVPGAWRCLKCAFALQKQTMFVQSGTIGHTREDVMNMTGEVCPNDGEPMVRETWHELAEAHYKWGVDLMEQVIALSGKDNLPAALEELAALRTRGAAPQQWKCFHCGMIITDEQHAREHFGPAAGNGTFCAERAKLLAEQEGAINQLAKVALLAQRAGWTGTVDTPVVLRIEQLLRGAAPARLRELARDANEEKHMTENPFINEWNDAVNCACDYGNEKHMMRWTGRVHAAGEALKRDYVKTIERANNEARLAVALRMKLEEVAGPDVASSIV